MADVSLTIKHLHKNWWKPSPKKLKTKQKSQNCSNCAVKVQKSLSPRTHKCLHCGQVQKI